MNKHNVSIHATADILADLLKARVKCDRVLVSFEANRFLYSVGLDSESQSEKMPRKHEMSDTVCARTMSRGEPLRIQDASQEPEFKDLGYVKHGGIRGYLGAPIRDSFGDIAGAVCAISDTPRDWNESERQLIEGISLALRHAIDSEQLREENTHLRRELHTADEAMMVLSQTTKPMTSVHRNSGDLVFVSRSLSHFVDQGEIESVVRATLNGAGSLEVTQGEPNSDSPLLVRVSDVLVSARSGQGMTFSAVLSRPSEGMVHVVWKIERKWNLN